MTGAVDRNANLEPRVLAAHNRERLQMGVPALSWDPQLADSAAQWASALARTGRFEHSASDPNAPNTSGENIWGGTPGAWSPEEMVGYWIAEKVDYRPGVFPAVSISGRLENVGHYTQIVWRQTRRVGCALVSGRREDVLVCHYSEGGNVIGERPI